MVFKKIQSLALAQTRDGQFKSPQANIVNLNFPIYIMFVWLTKTSQFDEDFFVSLCIYTNRGNLKFLSNILLNVREEVYEVLLKVNDLLYIYL